MHLKKKTKVDIDKVIEEIAEKYDQQKVDKLFSYLLNQWIYFFYLERDGEDAKPCQGNVEVILKVDKENPIDIPYVETDEGNFGVLYTNAKLSKKLAEFKCKIGKMKGKNAFSMFSGIEKLDGVCIQGNTAHIMPTKKQLAKWCKNAQVQE